MVSKSSEIMSNLKMTQQQIVAHAEAIHFLLKPFIEAQINFPGFDDLKKVYDSNLILKQQTIESLSPETLANTNDLNEYLSTVRHNLRNPINSMKGFTDILLEDIDNYEKTATSDSAKKQIKNIKTQLIQVDTVTLNIIKLIDQIKIAGVSGTAEEVKRVDIDFEKKEFLINFNKNLPILIVDDIDANCKLLERHLNHLGYYNILIAHNGEQALAMKESISLMLLDVEMPGMSGIEILTQLKKDISDRKLSVIIISGYDSIDKSINCIKLGAEDFLMKPFNADLLRVRIGICSEKIWLYQKEKDYLTQIEVERQKYLELLNAVFPEVVVRELATTGKLPTRNYQDVAILFTDIVSFTKYCDTHTPDEIIMNLQYFADICEQMAIKHQLQKLKTIGDSFLGVGGMLSISKNPVLDCINCAIDLIEETKKLKSGWQIRTGIHFGSVIGGIVGHRQYLFDIWGDSVNVAARVQDLSDPNTIYLTKVAYDQVKDVFKAEALGERAVKGKGLIEVYKIDPAKL